ncbi:Nif3-like dinuclear metal center hexameric protein [Bacillus cereus group sp. BfR-BA-01380]|uniref:Nif3-like dinuclear metal center hexameric protein n=1 Tax=Bacillus cereus group sp. BfR-BA-01380 TaxID=2920324 RepID=UPI001F5811DA|nr:Nif3-like dinuclear metal center hexameric protein [Bacillus cereus group sp. BfR-BA-01380]
MVKLNEIVSKLNVELDIKSFGKDTSFSRFIPMVYEPLNFEWKAAFEKDFVELFNGLMLKGDTNVEKVFLAVFPTDKVLERFIEESKSGDFLFMHHPLLMECGDPKGEWGQGFVPIKEKYIKQIKEKNLSVYTCHIPLDCHKQLGTNIAMAKMLNAEILVDDTLNAKNEYVLYCNIEKTNTDNLISTLENIFEIPYVDFEGQKLEDIQRIVIVAGCGDVVDWMKEAEENGVQAYITGEIHCHIDNDYGKQKYKQMMQYASNTSMSLIGVSHSASEYLVHKTLMKDWFEKNFSIETVLIPQEKWWL